MAGLQCFGCGQEFGFFRREHGCKKCGMLFCSSCTSNTVILPEQGTKKSKVCDQCYRNATREQTDQPESVEKSALNDLNRNTPLSSPSTSLYQKNSSSHVTTGRNITNADTSENENVSVDPDAEIRKRLDALKTDGSDGQASDNSAVPLSDQALGERFENLTGRKATSMQKSDINTPRPKKSEAEEIDALMKQMLEENKLDDEVETSAVKITDQEIESRLAKLRDMDPGLTNKPPDLDSDEDDETANKRYLKQILDEAVLEAKTEAMDFDGAESKSQKPAKSKPKNSTPSATKLSSIFSKDYEASSDDEEELPWCCICNGNAVLRCHGCDDDLYCRRCYKEGHSREDYDDHDISEYRTPRKKR